MSETSRDPGREGDGDGRDLRVLKSNFNATRVHHVCRLWSKFEVLDRVGAVAPERQRSVDVYLPMIVPEFRRDPTRVRSSRRRTR